jgi:murein hydrolase activator
MWLAVAGLLTVQAGANSQPAIGAPRSDSRAHAADRLRTLHQESDRLASEERTVLRELRQSELARQIANEELARAESEADSASNALDQLNDRVSELEHERDTERPRVRARLVEMYKRGRGQYMKWLLSTSDARSLGRATRTVTALAARDRERVATFEQRLADLEAARASAQSHQVDLEVRRAEAERARTAAERAIAQQNGLVREIDQRRDLNARLAGELQAAQVRLEATLKEGQPAGSTWLPIGPFRGALPWPATGVATRPSRGSAGRGDLAARRPGIEIQAPEGSSVVAIHGGTVAYAGSFEGLGNLVILDHGQQSFSLYGQLLDMAVGRGDEVGDRQEIGRVGGSRPDLPALYFELRISGRPVDPLDWLERAGEKKSLSGARDRR